MAKRIQTNMTDHIAVRFCGPEKSRCLQIQVKDLKIGKDGAVKESFIKVSEAEALALIETLAAFVGGNEKGIFCV